MVSFMSLVSLQFLLSLCWLFWSRDSGLTSCTLPGKRERDRSCLMSASTDGVYSSHECERPKCNEKSCTPDDLDLLIKARKLGSLKLSPKDEVEGEIIYYQDRLLHNIIARNCVTGIHIFR